MEVKEELDGNAGNTFRDARSTVVENDRLNQEIQDIKRSVAQASENIDCINVDADALSSNTQTIATAAENASQSVATMASAAQQITANIAGVSHNLEQVNAAVSEATVAIDLMAHWRHGTVFPFRPGDRRGCGRDCQDRGTVQHVGPECCHRGSRSR